MEERWSADQVLALAPDAASRKAGARLAMPASWSGTGTAEAAVWGLCAGSGSKPYQTVVDTKGPGYTCSCPSRKFPCKHALGLLLLWSEASDGAVGRATAPDWVTEWLDSRQERTRAAAAGPAKPADPEAARRRAERRAQRVTAGVMELEQRLTDLLRGGLAGADRAGYQKWDEIAARMVDAQAPGLAGRVRELGAVAAGGGDWPSRLLEESALLHLLTRGYLREQRLPGPLAATVRSRVGFTTDAAELLAGPTVRDRWLVLAQLDSSDDRLTTRRIWLHGARSGRVAMLLAFGAAGRAPELALPLGLSLDAEVAFYPSAQPLRAVLGDSHGPASPGSVPAGVPVGPALAAYGSALADDPWLDAWPVVLSGVVPIPGPDSGGWQLADADGRDALPIAGRSPWRLAAVSGGHPVTLFAELGHTGVRPLTAWGQDAAPVPL